MTEKREHPDVQSIRQTGWPRGMEEENRDSRDNRIRFAREHPGELVDYLLAGNGEVIDEFASHYGWKYRAWLN